MIFAVRGHWAFARRTSESPLYSCRRTSATRMSGRGRSNSRARRSHHPGRVCISQGGESVSVVIVNPDEATAAEHAHELYLAGYSTIAATSFPEVRELLSIYQPKALISTVRLGDYNGVHLAIVTRMKHGPVPTILL